MKERGFGGRTAKEPSIGRPRIKRLMRRDVPLAFLSSFFRNRFHATVPSLSIARHFLSAIPHRHIETSLSFTGFLKTQHHQGTTLCYRAASRVISSNNSA